MIGAASLLFNTSQFPPFFGSGLLLVFALVVGLRLLGVALPIELAFFASAITAGLTPGYILFRILSRAGWLPSSAVETFLSAAALSVSVSLLIHILTLILDVSLPVIVIVFYYSILFILPAIVYRDTKRDFEYRPATEASDRVLAAMRYSCIGILAIIFILTFYNAPPANQPEELLVLRKLLENPEIRLDNISSGRGEAFTYLLAPYFVLVATISIFSAFDVSLIYSLMWAPLSILAIVSISAMIKELFNNELHYYVSFFFLGAIGILDSYSVLRDIGVIIPYGNRYGYASGVLLVLILYFILKSVRSVRTSSITAFLIIYLTLELTFVHAREAALLLGVILVLFILLWSMNKEKKYNVVFVLRVFFVSITILLFYKYINLSYSGYINNYVSALSAVSREWIKEFVHTYGVAGALFAAPPPNAPIEVAPGIELDTRYVTYSRLFFDSWKDGAYASRLFLPLFIILMPVYVLMTGSAFRLLGPCVITSLAVVSGSGLINLAVSALVGNPEVISSFNVIYMFTFVFVVDTVVLIGYRTRDFFYRSPKRGYVLLAGGLASLGLLLIAIRLGFASEVSVAIMNVIRGIWDHNLHVALHAVTVMLIVFKVARYRGAGLLENIQSQARTQESRSFHLLAPAALLLGFSLILFVGGWRNWNLLAGMRDLRSYTGNLYEDVDLLRKKGRLPVNVSTELFRYLRELPANQNILAARSFAITLITNHYSPTMTWQANERLDPTILTNWDYMKTFGQRLSFSMSRVLNDTGGERLLARILCEKGVDIVVVERWESAEVERTMKTSPAVARLFESVHEVDGHLVLSVRRDAC